MTGFVAGIGARIAGSLIIGKAKSAAASGVGLLREIPEPVWEGASIVGYALALFALHQHYANAAIRAADQAGYERRATEDAAALVELQAKERAAETNAKAISEDSRSKNDAEVNDIHSSAAALGVRGPGAAAASCGRVDHPAVPAAASQPQPAAQQPSASPDPVPAKDGSDALAVVPWRWLVGTGEQCDIERAENISWRNAYAGWAAEWEKLRSGNKSAPSPAGLSH